MGPAYFVLSVSGTVIALGLMIEQVQLKQPESCMWWFANGVWSVGGTMAVGLVGEYMNTVGITQEYFASKMSNGH